METEKLTLEEIRARIDVIDSEMKQLFLSRYFRIPISVF